MNCFSSIMFCAYVHVYFTINLLIITTTLHPFNGLFTRITWISRYQKG